ncbi:helix-turn-helix domain-containing protein [Cohnella faecalis]|uniref:Helix-turn-helix domain-containing protein n=1 Tax=Cohnella faecalis TaxID=2315694 RepID=A0A398CEE3_9BACL|nr:helix-turn-helix domain-containing protein [Cohnella faecalis]RIE00815.1 helix-turn-helix domain-containing protein [Cohnella faecalis]
MPRLFMKRLKELRNRKKMSQEELAGALNIPRTTIAGYESGIRSLPRERRLKHIASYFGVSIDYLIGFTDEENEPEDLQNQIVKLIRSANVHYDYKYTYSDKEKEQIIEILLNIASMDQAERKHALDLIGKMAKT